MSKNYITIGKRKIGSTHPPFIIAEMSGNHNHSLERALEIVEKAAAAKVDAIKLQTYTADTITLDVNGDDFLIQDENNLWKGQNLYNLYSDASTPWEWHKPIIEKANQLGILCFSTPFDESAVDFLEKLDVPAYKIASPEVNHLPLIEKVAKTEKPLILSTGMASISEIGEAVQTARDEGCQDIILLKCTSTYPASPENSNILTLPHMKKLFDCEVGISDHTLGIGVSVAGVAHGASVIEKHFTLSRADGGVDSAFSLEPDELESLVSETNNAWKALGDVKYGPTDAEIPSLKFRRSLYISKDVNVGDILSEDNVKCIRPSFGLDPKYYTLVLGKQVNQSLKRGTPLRWEYLLD